MKELTQSSGSTYSYSKDCAVSDSDSDSDWEDISVEFSKISYQGWITGGESLLSQELKKAREKSLGRSIGEDKTHAPTIQDKQDKQEEQEKQVISLSKVMDAKYTSVHMNLAVRVDSGHSTDSSGYNSSGW